METVIIETLLKFVPSLITLSGVIIMLALANYLVRRNVSGEIPIMHQVMMLLLTAAGILMVIFSLPISEASRGQVLSLLGIVITAVIALSSTTFVANIMAGLMLRAVNSFGPGDFIRSENFFGKVTERGIFHTEIQTEDRDLMTLPNMYLVNNPVTVVHESGTIISATLSLGYDVSHRQVEELLKQAAEKSGFADCFTLVTSLGDFSITYRVGGFSSEVNRLLSEKSKLHKNILSILHENHIEIVSPGFMNQRVFDSQDKMIPTWAHVEPEPREDRSPEDVIFDKADSAAEKEDLKKEESSILAELKSLDETIKSTEDEAVKEQLLRQRELLAGRVAEIKAILEQKTGEED